MTIYLDVVLLENLVMNYIILFASGYILKVKTKYFRLILAALLGGIYSILAYMKFLKIYTNFIFKIILSILMVYIAYKPKNFKELAKELIFFYLTSFVFGGCAFALLYFIKPQDILMRNGVLVGTYPLKIAILGGLIGFIIIAISFKFVKNKLNKKDIYCKIKIFFNKKSIEGNALLDTGNMLVDPISRVPVIVAEKEILKNILPDKLLNNLNKIIGGEVPKDVYEDENLEYITKFRLIPFSSLGKANGMLLGFKADKVEIENQSEIKKVIVGIYDNKLSKNGKYNVLIGLNTIEND